MSGLFLFGQLTFGVIRLYLLMSLRETINRVKRKNYGKCTRRCVSTV